MYFEDIQKISRPIHPGLAEADQEVLVEDLIKEMDKAGVDKAILFHSVLRIIT